MRIDKYLKVSRLIKRRELAKEMLDKGMIKVNGRVAKPALEIKPGDLVALTSPSGKTVEFTILKTLDYTTSEEAGSMYEMKEGQ
jgi:ribosomal 50S subunit-recycling heat shock protein